MHTVVEAVTGRIRSRSAGTRKEYLDRIERAAQAGPARGVLSCSNLAHGMAACDRASKDRLTDELVPNIGIVTAYNDMLSAHQPYENYPALIRDTARQLGAVAQVAGGVPAMCDGITQGQDGMDLSLFSRDVIALSTALALSHNMFDAALCLGICDKIVPGLLMGALSFGHLPVAFVPAGPMPSGLPNKEKARVREAYAGGEVDKAQLIAAESASYHSPGTCTFYGTANSNQMLMEIMGLQLPGSSFVNPTDPLREPMTRAAVATVLGNTCDGEHYIPLGRIVSAEAIVNGIVGLLATGGSTNHTIHLVAIAAAAGIRIDWTDMAELSAAVPLLAQVYPSGQADVNHFHEAGGMAFIIGELLDAGLLHDEVATVLGHGLRQFAYRPALDGDRVHWSAGKVPSGDLSVLRGVERPFAPEGGIRLVQGNLGRAVVKVAAVEPQHRRISAGARLFTSQEAFVNAADAGELNEDMVAVLPFQGPAAVGMPELHKLTPYLGVMQNKGLQVALLTDGRMSGASGKVLAAIHTTPEAEAGGSIARIEDGDMITIDAEQGILHVDADLASRPARQPELSTSHVGMGRELFSGFRSRVNSAEAGASVLG